jgi:hypothetical protein
MSAILLRGGLILLETSTHCGLPIFLKVNHQLESRMQEICQSGSEGGAKSYFVPTPIDAESPRPGGTVEVIVSPMAPERQSLNSG